MREEKATHHIEKWKIIVIILWVMGVIGVKIWIGWMIDHAYISTSEEMVLDVNEQQSQVFQDKMEFHLPEGAKITQVKFSSDIEPFTSYTSPFLNENISECSLYSDIEMMKNHKPSKEVTCYSYEGVDYVEIRDDVVWDKETEKSFNSFQQLDEK